MSNPSEPLWLERYGVTWDGSPGKPLLTPMPDGFWTPWHEAVDALNRMAAHRGGKAAPPNPSEPLWRELLAAANEHLVAWLPEDESRTRRRLSAAVDALAPVAARGPEQGERVFYREPREAVRTVLRKLADVIVDPASRRAVLLELSAWPTLLSESPAPPAEPLTAQQRDYLAGLPSQPQGEAEMDELRGTQSSVHINLPGGRAARSVKAWQDGAIRRALKDLYMLDECPTHALDGTAPSPTEARLYDAIDAFTALRFGSAAPGTGGEG